jgi:hypothetical protein
MSHGASAPDYYGILQVHARAETEVIEAAYRQLMKKYHPDRAGDDQQAAAILHERAKIINEAYSVLRDPVRRRAYDAQRLAGGSWSSASRGQPPPPSAPPPGPATATAPPYDPTLHSELVEIASEPAGPLQRVLAMVATAYYLLPGRYEWEPGHAQDLLLMLAIPPLGLIGWALATGRLGPLIGRGPLAGVLAWVVLGVVSLPLVRLAPRLALAAGPTLLLLSGTLDAPLRQAHLPAWLGWMVAVLIGMVFSARLYVFAVLPTLALYALVSRLT